MHRWMHRWAMREQSFQQQQLSHFILCGAGNCMAWHRVWHRCACHWIVGNQDNAGSSECVTRAFSKDTAWVQIKEFWIFNFQSARLPVPKTSLSELTADLYDLHQVNWVSLCANETNSPTQSSRDGDSSCPNGQSHWKLPSVFTQVPPLQRRGLRSHSSMSER